MIIVDCKKNIHVTFGGVFTMSTTGQSPESPPRWVPSLSGEADHRIANSLTMISSLVRLRAARAHDVTDARTFLMEIVGRIETVAQLHRLIAQSASGSVQLSRYLRDICGRLSDALTSRGATFSVDCAPEQIVPSRMALPLGLITAELFSNSVKYSHPAGLPVKIAISCGRAQNDRLRFVYEDDGVGFPEGFDFRQGGHQGMRFIRLLSGQLDGTPEWASHPLGIQFELSVPLPSRDEEDTCGQAEVETL